MNQPPTYGMQPVPNAHGTQLPIAPADAVRNVGVCILLSLVTCGIYGMYWQYLQFRAINAFLGRREHDFWMYFLLTFITCGIYALYYEYKFALTVCEVQRSRGLPVNENLPFIAVGLAVFGLAMVTWCIEQTEINKLCGQSS
jgi:Domain of unknown function (DUF4234)